MTKLLLLFLFLVNLSFATNYDSDASKLKLANCFKGKAPDKYEWIKSAFVYNNINKCFNDLIKYKARYGASLRGLEILSGISIDQDKHSTIIKDDNYGGNQALKINPKFVKWIENYFLLAPSNSALFVKTKALYKEYRDFIRSFALAHHFLHQGKDYEQELVIYENIIAEGKSTPSHIFKRYQDEIETLYPKVENSDAIIYGTGFWLRRSIDGSATSLQQLLVKLLNIYDAKWYKSINTLTTKPKQETTVINLDKSQKNQLNSCLKGQAPSNDGWMNALFLYGEGMACFDKLLDRKRPDFYSLSALEILSGLKLDSRKFSSIIAKDRYRSGKQLFLSPLFVTWLEDNFIIKDKASTMFVNYANIYKEYAAFVRSFALAYHYVNKVKSFQKEYLAYLKASKVPYQTVEYLFKRYQHDIHSRYRDVTNPDAIIYSIGFWMRRTIDKSKEPLKKLLDTLLQTYDSVWYKENFHDKKSKVIKSSPGMKW